MESVVTRLGVLLLVWGHICHARTPKTVYGCKYNPILCSGYETCGDDNLFGTCQNVLAKTAVVKFKATDTLRDLLEFSLKGLLSLGYGWTDDYSQCIIGGVLDTARRHVTPQLGYCDSAEKRRLQLAARSHISGRSAANEATVDPAVYRDQTTPVSNDLLSELSKADLQFIQKYLSVSRPPINIALESSSTPAVAAAAAHSPMDDVELSETDQWLLEQLVSDVKSVDDLTTSQIKRLRTYLQMVLAEQTTPGASTDTKGSKTTPGASTDTKGSKTTPAYASESATTDHDKPIAEILRKFTSDSMNNEHKNTSSKARIHRERLNEDIIGQQISNRLQDMGQSAPSRYVDKKSGVVVRSGIVEAPEKEPEMTDPPQLKTTTMFALVDTSYVWVKMDKTLSKVTAAELVSFIASELKVDRSKLDNERYDGSQVYSQVYFQVYPGATYNSTQMAAKIEDELGDKIFSKYGIHVLATGIGHDPEAKLQVAPIDGVPMASNTTTIVIIATVLVVVVVAVLILITWRCMYRKWSFSVNRFEKLSSQLKGESTQDSYEDLCRQRMQAATDDKKPTSEVDKVSPLKSRVDMPGGQPDRLKSPRSSTSSWSEEPVNMTMDISTGHTVLAYMEDHLKNSERLEQEWSALESYTPDRCDVEVGKLNFAKNRFADVLPYDHNRVQLTHDSENGYINASSIADHDPRNPAYIATQGPLQSTVPQFWQMVWEHDCSSIVMVTSLAENNKTVCHQYWPSEGRHKYGNFEIHLVSEHSWCEAYLVRSLYLKNLETGETRTVTQFHFLSWPDQSVPEGCKYLLDFRRKVNKSYRGRTSPIVVLCSDGSGRSGAYILLDMVINRIHKGIKEIDIAATLEHIRDQRMDCVQTKEQFGFVLSAVAEEVQALLRALPQ